MAVRSEYPIEGDPIVRGEPLTISIDVTREVANNEREPVDISDWQWRAEIRRSLGGPLVARFQVSAVAPEGSDVPSQLLLHLPANQTQELRTGYVFDLEQLAPVPRVWWVCTRLKMMRDAARD